MSTTTIFGTTLHPSNAAKGAAWNSNGSGGSDEGGPYVGGPYVAITTLPCQQSLGPQRPDAATKQSVTANARPKSIPVEPMQVRRWLSADQHEGAGPRRRKQWRYLTKSECRKSASADRLPLVGRRAVRGDERHALITSSQREANCPPSRRPGLCLMGWLNCPAFGQARQDRPGIPG